MARPRTKGKRLALGIDIGLAGWLEWQGRAYDHGQSEYINALIQADRSKRIADEEQARRYRLYLEACGYTEELEMLDAGALALDRSADA